MRKRATAEDVARAAGASIAEASRRKVPEAAAELRYRPNLLARSLATNLTHQIAVFVDDFANPYKLRLIEALTGERARASVQISGCLIARGST